MIIVLPMEPYFQANPDAGTKRAPPEAPRGAPRQPLGEDGPRKQVAGQVQHQHDALPEESRLGQVQVCQLEGKHSHTGATKRFHFHEHCFILLSQINMLIINPFLKGNLDPHGKHTEPS